MNRRNFLTLTSLSPFIVNDLVAANHDIILSKKEFTSLINLKYRLKKLKRFIGYANFNILSFQDSDVTMVVSTATTMIAADIVALTSTTRRCRSLCLTTTDVLAGELCTAVALLTNASLCLEAVVSVTIILVDNSVKPSH